MTRRLRKIWICNDVWLNILPFFDRPQLGLNLALISYRFDALVDKNFDGKTELTLMKWITINKDKEPKAKLCVYRKPAEFPFADRPLPNKIRFRGLLIEYIDHSVLTFLHSNKQIWDSRGTKLDLFVCFTDDQQRIWDFFVDEIWPIFVTNIRHLAFSCGDQLDNLRCRTSPTILTELNINSIYSDRLCPAVLAENDFDGQNVVTYAGEALAKWLHTPTKDGQPKRLRCMDYLDPPNLEWINNFKEVFVHAHTSAAVCYTVHFSNCHVPLPIEPFELVNERTNEKLTLTMNGAIDWCCVFKRFPIIGETAANDENSAENLNNVFFRLNDFKNSIGPLSPPANKSNEKVFSSLAGPSSDQSGMNE